MDCGVSTAVVVIFFSFKASREVPSSEPVVARSPERRVTTERRQCHLSALLVRSERLSRGRVPFDRDCTLRASTLQAVLKHLCGDRTTHALVSRDYKCASHEYVFKWTPHSPYRWSRIVHAGGALVEVVLYLQSESKIR